MGSGSSGGTSATPAPGTPDSAIPKSAEKSPNDKK
jgi:hypothetical protein